MMEKYQELSSSCMTKNCWYSYYRYNNSYLLGSQFRLFLFVEVTLVCLYSGGRGAARYGGGGSGVLRRRGGGHGIDVGSAGGSEAASRSSSSMIQRIGVR